MTAESYRTHAGASHSTPALRDYLKLLQRRKWIVIQTIVVMTLLALFLSFKQDRLYRSGAQVLLNRENPALSLVGLQTPAGQPDRDAATQAAAAQVPRVAARAVTLAGYPDISPRELLNSCDVAPAREADILNFSCTNEIPTRARNLATAFATAYTDERRRLDTASLKKALASVTVLINQMRASGQTNSPVFQQLLASQQNLKTFTNLQEGNVSVLRQGDRPEQVQPRVVRNGILGFIIGALIGVALAFLIDALDTRVRSGEEIQEKLGLPLLARLPEPNKRLRTEHRLVTLANPNSVQAEAFRMLRTNLEFVNLDRGARSIMVTSAFQTEGKSTTIANLAVAFTRAGRRVALVDLDLRRPFLDKFFDIEGTPGLTQVALGHADLESALVSVSVSSNGARASEGNGRGQVAGLLEVLPTGPLPPDPGEFVGTGALGDILQELRSRADIVLIDSPPVLQVGDAMTLSAKVDAMLIVARLNVIRRPMLNELRRTLAACPAAKLGFVLAGSDLEEGYGYGYGYYYRPREAGRVAEGETAATRS